MAGTAAWKAVYEAQTASLSDGSSPTVTVTHRLLRVVEARMQTARSYVVEAQAELLDHVEDDDATGSRRRIDGALEHASLALLAATTLIREGVKAPLAP